MRTEHHELRWEPLLVSDEEHGVACGSAELVQPLCLDRGIDIGELVTPTAIRLPKLVVNGSTSGFRIRQPWPDDS